MHKNILMLCAFLGMVVPFNVKADEVIQMENVVAITEKYYKTVTEYGDTLLRNGGSEDNITSYTVEVSREEFEQAPAVMPFGNTSIETTYKSLTSSISRNDDYYRYKAVLNWKNMPSRRSHDIIGIGFNPNVQISLSTHFSDYYCESGGSCYTSTTNTPQTFFAGAGTTFLLPSGTLTTLKQTFYFDVEKAVNVTITGQSAVADYSHATSNVSLSAAQNYEVSLIGIELDSSISSKYDSMPYAEATWSGSW